MNSFSFKAGLSSYLSYQDLLGGIFQYETDTITKYSIWYEYKDFSTNGKINYYSKDFKGRM